jgi:hypothetical protein
MMAGRLPAAMIPSLRPLRGQLLRVLLAVALVGVVCAMPAGQEASSGPGPESFLTDLESALLSNDATRFAALYDPTLSEEDATSLAAQLRAEHTTRAVVRERDRLVVPDTPVGSTFRLLADVFLESGDRARVGTFRFDVRRMPGDSSRRWRLIDTERLSSVDGLHRLRLDRTRQYAVSGLRLSGEDFELALPRGAAFVSSADEGITGLVLVGEGVMTFAPRPAAEKVQVRIFSGKETLVTPFSMALVRLNPGELQARLDVDALTPAAAVDRRALGTAQDYFDAQIGRSFSLDLSDLSRDTWSLVPGFGDLLADVRTKRYGVLTYARSNGEAEDITVFDRNARRNISVYASLRKLETRGQSYNEDDLADYDVIDYELDAAYTPAREWLQGVTRLRLRVRPFALATVTLRLAESLTVHSVQSDRHGRLLSIRVRGQNSVLVSLPTAVARDEIITLTVRYSGRLESLAPEREVVQVSQSPFGADVPLVSAEPRWVFSNRSYWYPQGTVSDFALARLRLTVPAGFDVIASGDPDASNPEVERPANLTDVARLVYRFDVRQPVRYMSWAISRLEPVGRTEIALPDDAPGPATSGDGDQAPASLVVSVQQGVFYRSMDVVGLANPRQVRRGRDLLEQAADILRFYGGVVQDFPYPTFTLTLVDHEVPGGHSPAYFALLHQPLPTTPFAWRNDPVHFDEYPLFFLAHELAHQFWGQAVGWKSYHEQWISEGFAQYFALLYAERKGGADTMRSVLGRMRRTAIERADQGPITLGYRLGHIKGDSRVFRSIVYNKGAMVLHMLRRSIGDEAFFRGLRSFYRFSRFTKVGTDEARAAFETSSARSLERFFEGWIREFDIPTVACSGTQADGALRLTFRQRGPAILEFPVTVTLRYADGSTEDAVVVIDAAEQVRSLPLRGALRSWAVNEDRGTLANFTGAP